MTKEQLKNNIIVYHIKTNKKYKVLFCNSRLKDSVNNWIDSVVYAPLYENDYDCFCREKSSFIKDFDLVKV